MCVRVFCRRDRARLFPTASHMLGHTAALCPQLHGTQGKKKGKTNTSGSVGGHPLSVRELHVKWNIIFNNSVLISLFDWNSRVCVCVCLVTSLLL